MAGGRDYPKNSRKASKNTRLCGALLFQACYFSSMWDMSHLSLSAGYSERGPT